MLVRAPVQVHAIPGRSYRLYTDACNYGLPGILQQVQPMRVCDLQGTKVYEHIEQAYLAGEGPPSLVVAVGSKKTKKTTETKVTWAKDWNDTEILVERVVAYWSRVLKPVKETIPQLREKC